MRETVIALISFVLGICAGATVGTLHSHAYRRENRTRTRRSGLKFAYYDEPTWFLLAFVAFELAVVVALLAVLVAR